MVLLILARQSMYLELQCIMCHMVSFRETMEIMFIAKNIIYCERTLYADIIDK